MGGSPKPPRVDPMAAYRAQQAAAEAARKRLEAERGASADRFLADNAITDEFRAGIQGQSDEAMNTQLAGLDSSIKNTLMDIRQRNAGRGLSGSSSATGMLGQAEALGEQSRQDLLDSARRRVDSRLRDQQAFLDDAAASIRSGASPASAQARFRSDISSANAAFENALSQATSGDQRNVAFQNFENDRRMAAARFKENVNQFGSQGTLASLYSNKKKTGTSNAGQVGGGFTGSLS